MGTDWSMPADLSALGPVCLYKKREVRGEFGEGMREPVWLCVQRLCVCERECVREGG